MFYRLAIVEKHKNISRFVEERLKFMTTKDIGVASFLLYDKQSVATMTKKYGYRENKVNSSQEIIHFEKSLGEKIETILLDRGLPKEDLLVVNTAYTPKAVDKMIHQLGGQIILMSKIATTTDDGNKINVLGTIFKKGHHYNKF
ncbi:MAG: hypothetical protein KR126chlam5_00905 [Candidatus Anoxychlamydiales bacterium]|nr:hypothetical protein [Candidatus Anoxychlamydiales bacterium]NGX52602.1 hypothetical protein [Candidatus Anoxychlamydiales bacterium]